MAEKGAQQMNIPSYPTDFNECLRDKRKSEEVRNEKINDEIKKMISFMNEHKSKNHSISFEDVLIIIDRIEEDGDVYFEISVTKEHHRARVKSD